VNLDNAVNLGLVIIFGMAFIVAGIRHFSWARERRELEEGPSFGAIRNWEVRLVDDRGAATRQVGLVVTTPDADGDSHRHFAILTPEQGRMLAGWLREGSP
jgi:hypothetical protein